MVTARGRSGPPRAPPAARSRPCLPGEAQAAARLGSGAHPRPHVYLRGNLIHVSGTDFLLTHHKWGSCHSGVSWLLFTLTPAWKSRASGAQRSWGACDLVKAELWVHPPLGSALLLRAPRPNLSALSTETQTPTRDHPLLHNLMTASLTASVLNSEHPLHTCVAN